MQVVIDNRENKKFCDRVIERLVNISIQIRTMDIGDILIESAEGNPILLFERKAVRDLLQSVSDGRYKEQKARLTSTENKALRTYYIVEGLTTKLDVTEMETYKSCILNTTIRDKIFMFVTRSIDETIDLISDIYKRLPKFIDELVVDNKPCDYAETIKIKKRDNLTPKICYIAQLRTIPGVSNAAATEIVKLYPRMPDLILAFTNEQQQTIKNISDIKPTPKRKLGKKIAEKIYSHLFT